MHTVSKQCRCNTNHLLFYNVGWCNSDLTAVGPMSKCVIDSPTDVLWWHRRWNPTAFHAWCRQIFPLQRRAIESSQPIYLQRDDGSGSFFVATAQPHERASFCWDNCAGSSIGKAEMTGGQQLQLSMWRHYRDLNYLPRNQGPRRQLWHGCKKQKRDVRFNFISQWDKVSRDQENDGISASGYPLPCGTNCGTCNCCSWQKSGWLWSGQFPAATGPVSTLCLSQTSWPISVILC